MDENLLHPMLEKILPAMLENLSPPNIPEECFMDLNILSF